MQSEFRECLPFCTESCVFRLLSKYIKIKVNKTIILPVFSYWWEMWSVVLKEVRRLRMIENMVLMKILRPKIGQGSREL